MKKPRPVEYRVICDDDELLAIENGEIQSVGDLRKFLGDRRALIAQIRDKGGLSESVFRLRIRAYLIHQFMASTERAVWLAVWLRQPSLLPHPLDFLSVYCQLEFSQKQIHDLLEIDPTLPPKLSTELFFGPVSDWSASSVALSFVDRISNWLLRSFPAEHDVEFPTEVPDTLLLSNTKTIVEWMRACLANADDYMLSERDWPDLIAERDLNALHRRLVFESGVLGGGEAGQGDKRNVLHQHKEAAERFAELTGDEPVHVATIRRWLEAGYIESRGKRRQVTDSSLVRYALEVRQEREKRNFTRLRVRRRRR